MDTRLLKILDEEVAKEEAKKKKKPIFKVIANLLNNGTYWA